MNKREIPEWQEGRWGGHIFESDQGGSPEEVAFGSRPEQQEGARPEEGTENAPGRGNGLGKSPEVGTSLENGQGGKPVRGSSVRTHTLPFSLNVRVLTCEMGSTIPAEYGDGHTVLISGPKWSLNTWHSLIALITGPSVASFRVQFQHHPPVPNSPHRAHGAARPANWLWKGSRPCPRALHFTAYRAPPPALPLPCRTGG